MSSNTDIAPIFCKALSLLHSTAKSSTEQLKSLLDEYLAIKTDKNVTIDSIKPAESKIKEPQKRPAKPLPAVVKAKKSKSHSSPSSRNHSPEPVKLKSSPPQIIPLSVEPVAKIKKEEDSDATDIEDESTDAGEFALEMGLACVVCKQLDFAPGNQPVECSECHNLYHQECHKPPITDRDVSDPRNVWYCAKCIKNMEKASKKSARANNKSPILTSSASFQSAVNSGRETAFQLIKAKAAENQSSTNTSNIMQPFKRVEMKIPQSPGANGPVSSNPTTPTKPIGLAGLAANLSRTSSPSISSPTSASSSSNNSATSPTPSIPPFNLSSSSSSTTNSASSSVPSSNSANLSKADKRIAQMKKKAANKKMLSTSK